MTQQELIFKLQNLKQIKPNSDWVALSKTSMFAAPVVRKASVFEAIFQRRMAFSFATLLFMFAGVAGLLNYQLNSGVKVASLSSAAQTVAEATLKDNVKEFKEKTQILAEVIKNKSSNSEIAIKEVKSAAKSLTDNIQKNPELAKTIALDVNNNRTILDNIGGKDAKDINSPYEVIANQLIKDMKKTTKTPEQEERFVAIEKAYDNGEDPGIILRDLLLMSVSMGGESN